MRLLVDRFRVYAVDLRGQGRSTWTPGRYSLDIVGGDLVRFMDRIVARPAVVSGLSSGGVVAAWLSAFAAPGQIWAAVYEDAPLFASEAAPAVGQSISQGMGPVFRSWHKWLGSQWSIGDFTGLQAALPRELPAWLLQSMPRMASEAPAPDPPQNLREYDPEWGEAFAGGRASLSCDHENLLRHVKVPVLFTHHFHDVDPETGHLAGAISDQQVERVRHLVAAGGNTFTYRAFPSMPHAMHSHDPVTFVHTLTEWLTTLAGGADPAWAGTAAP